MLPDLVLFAWTRSRGLSVVRVEQASKAVAAGPPIVAWLPGEGRRQLVVDTRVVCLETPGGPLRVRARLVAELGKHDPPQCGRGLLRIVGRAPCPQREAHASNQALVAFGA